MRGSSKGDLATRAGNTQYLGDAAAIPGGAVAGGGGRACGAPDVAVLEFEAAQGGAGSAAGVPAAHYGAVARAGGAADRGVHYERGIGRRTQGRGRSGDGTRERTSCDWRSRTRRTAFCRARHDGLPATGWRRLRGRALERFSANIIVALATVRAIFREPSRAYRDPCRGYASRPARSFFLKVLDRTLQVVSSSS